MRSLNASEVNMVSGGREARGAYNSNGPDRTRAQAMRENNPGRDWSNSDLNNVSLALGLAGTLVPGIWGRGISALGAAGAAVSGWKRKDK
ncbi:hypothetical protein ACED66_02445 [Vibrio splendidus]|uniref:hypothetical protein n=1 Tax=Vibrio TaxID=662 RepID=UPI000D377650|nr:hypothetical protein [Vibrio splendidus]PTO59626.1 hypothetical protein CWN82_05870 [Vibrio splendidus]PTP06795.1 hypothetical protein CWN88_00580 [Vibrio splendidus]PTQ11277.1 hypothetical protein CWO28_00990 [Vibrio splendidus]